VETPRLNPPRRRKVPGHHGHRRTTRTRHGGARPRFRVPPPRPERRNGAPPHSEHSL
jgi:hypothetical protein